MASITASVTQVQNGTDTPTLLLGLSGGQITDTSFAQSPGRHQLPPTHHWHGCPSSQDLLHLLRSSPYQRLHTDSAYLAAQSPCPSPACNSETLFPEGALYSGFIFRGSANKFLPNCPQTKKVHISALKVTGGIADQAWHICRPPPAVPTICSPGHPLPQLWASSSKSCPSIYPTSLLTPSFPCAFPVGLSQVPRPFPVLSYLVRW